MGSPSCQLDVNILHKLFPPLLSSQILRAPVLSGRSAAVTRLPQVLREALPTSAALALTHSSSPNSSFKLIPQTSSYTDRVQVQDPEHHLSSWWRLTTGPGGLIYKAPYHLLTAIVEMVSPHTRVRHLAYSVSFSTDSRFPHCPAHCGPHRAPVTTLSALSLFDT